MCTTFTDHNEHMSIDGLAYTHCTLMVGSRNMWRRTQLPRNWWSSQHIIILVHTWTVFTQLDNIPYRCRQNIRSHSTYTVYKKSPLVGTLQSTMRDVCVGDNHTIYMTPIYVVDGSCQFVGPCMWTVRGTMYITHTCTHLSSVDCNVPTSGLWHDNSTRGRRRCGGKWKKE